MSRSYCYAVLICFPLLLSGCWDRIELNDMAIVTALAVDQVEENRIRLTTQLLVTSGFASGRGQMQGGAGETGSSTVIRWAEGVNLSDAMSKLQAKLSRKLFLGHSKVYIFGESAARKGISSHIDYLMRHPEPRLQGAVYVSRGKAIEALDSRRDVLERSTAEALRELMNLRFELDTTLVDVRNALRSEKTGMVIPCLESGKTWEKEDPKKERPYTSGLAVFKKDKMVGILNAEESRGIIWLVDNVSTSTITIKPVEGEEGTISFQLMGSRLRMRPNVSASKKTMTIKLLMRGSITENTTQLDPAKREDLEVIESKLRETVTSDIAKTMKALQRKWKTDAVGFDKTCHEQEPDTWEQIKEQWEQLFSQLDITYESNVTIVQPGFITRSAKGAQEDVSAR